MVELAGLLIPDLFGLNINCFCPGSYCHLVSVLVRLGCNTLVLSVQQCGCFAGAVSGHISNAYHAASESVNSAVARPQQEMG